MSLRDDMAERLMVDAGLKPGLDRLTNAGRAKWLARADAALAVVDAWLGSDEVRAALMKVARDNAINCTGPGEVGCNGRMGWHSWTSHREHVAAAEADALRALARGEG